MTTTTISKWGNSNAVRIPEGLVFSGAVKGKGRC
ncbi:hypothetical protein PAECIP111893_03577 [Paenibacillus plantiphilus]|uniref:Uncharacterized protein n=1 Tax=Paenibacillus plantiphilus TaxID=2905650 RepID=A0ABN8GRY9_9BACL|nr:hypothetical protein PAECIP111893_03577 [Paenibacillus plantiphilus]